MGIGLPLKMTLISCFLLTCISVAAQTSSGNARIVYQKQTCSDSAGPCINAHELEIRDSSGDLVFEWSSCAGGLVVREKGDGVSEMKCYTMESVWKDDTVIYNLALVCFIRYESRTCLIERTIVLKSDFRPELLINRYDVLHKRYLKEVKDDSISSAFGNELIKYACELMKCAINGNRKCEILYLKFLTDFPVMSYGYGVDYAMWRCVLWSLNGRRE
jgi:hypothetical protein